MKKITKYTSSFDKYCLREENLKEDRQQQKEQKKQTRG